MGEGQIFLKTNVSLLHLIKLLLLFRCLMVPQLVILILIFFIYTLC
jgi:hypothetical protein